MNPTRLVLIAEPTDLDALREHGGLPLPETAGTLPFQRLADATPGIVAIARDGWVPSDQDGRTTARELEAAYQHLSESTVCYLVVLDSTVRVGERAVAPEAETSASTLNPSKNELAAHCDWYTRFRTSCGTAMSHRHVHVRHVLILVCCEAVPPTQLEDLNRLLYDNHGTRLFDACYVMLSRLEPGEAHGQFFSACDVWPIAVGGLLLKLMHDLPTASEEVLAWRCFQLVPEIDPARWNRLRRQQLKALADSLLTLPKAPSGWDSKVFEGFRPNIPGGTSIALDAPAEANAMSRSWLEYDPAQRLKDVASEQRWKSALQRAGDRFAQALSDRAIGEEPAVRAEIHKLWRSIHENPSATAVALSNKELIAGPPLGDQLKATQDGWQRVLDEDHARFEQIETARKCADHLNAAQQAFVPFWYRVIAVFATSLCLGYVAMTTTESWLGTGRAIWFALAGSLGALVAGFWSADAERRAGRKGQVEIERQLKEIDSRVKAKHLASQQVVEAADTFWQQLWTAAAGKHLRQLLFRVQTILDRELKTRPSRVSSAEVARSSDEDTSSSASVHGEWHRERFRDAVVLKHSSGAEFSSDVTDAAAFQSLIDKHALKFQHELWPQFCDEHDRLASGNFPARSLIPMLREFCARFESDLLSEVRRLAVENMKQNDPSLGAWGESLRQLTTHQRYFALMSCQFLSHQTVEVNQRPAFELYLRRGFTSSTLGTNLRTLGLTERHCESDALDELSLAGFVFQELPVRFAVTDGQVTVAASIEQAIR